MKLKRNTKVQFDALTHSYFCGDKELVGVTTLLGHQGLSPDYSGIDPHVLAHAAARGTAVHRLLEDYDNGKQTVNPVTVDDNEGGTLTYDAADELKAYKKLGLEVIASEYLVSDNKNVASSIDKVLATEQEDTVDLGDIKTTSTLHLDSLAWQLSIYAYLFELQNKDIKVRNLYGIHVRDGKAQVRQVRRIDTETVKRLIACEAKGERFVSDGAAPQLADIIPADEAAALVAAETELARLEEAAKRIKEAIAERRQKTYDYMLANGIDKLECPGGEYRFRRPTTRAVFDSKSFKADYPDIYDKYASETSVKGSVSFIPSNH